MIRARGPYGRKPDRGLLSSLSAFEPVDLYHYDEANDSFTIETRQNVNAILSHNRDLRLHGGDGYSPTREWRRAASLPLVIVHELYRRGINIFRNADWPKVAALLDSSEWQMFRTAPGKLSRRPVRTYPTEAWDRR